MAKRLITRGACQYCGTELAKNAMSRHLEKCDQRQTAVEKAQGKAQTLLYLRVQDAWTKEFWLDLEMRSDATLEDLDDYLRAIWLECCGHMSQFSFGRWNDEIAMSRKVGKVLQAGDELTHIYDFGTSSETLVKLMKTQQGVPTTKYPIALMARNLMPEVECQECGQSATHFCAECQIEDERPGMLCDQHAEEHPHDDYGDPIPLVNSPRLGMCGYDGPAEAPY